MNRLMVPVLVIWLCLAAGIESADARSSQESAVLPGAIDGWTWDGQEAHYDARTVFDYIDGVGELFLAYGFEQLAVRWFEKADQPPRVSGLIPGREAALVETSVRYVTSHLLLNQRLFIAHDNVLGLARETGAMLAQYGRDTAVARLLVVRYPTATEAGAAYGRFMAAYLPGAAGRDRMQTTDGRWAIAWQRQEMLAVVIGAPSEAAGEALLTATETAGRSAR